MRKRWILKTCDEKLVDSISKEFKIPAIAAKVLINRGHTSFDDVSFFLNATLKNLYDPFKMKDLHSACYRISVAIRNDENILIHGDYDADGVCSTVLLKTALDLMGAHTQYYIPHRVDDGYGLNDDIVSYVKQKAIKLVITVDCGTGSVSQIRALKDEGIDTIVTDHHETIDGAIAPAHSVVNPRQKDCQYPFKELAGVGVVFKLIQGLYNSVDISEYQHLLDLVAIGTVGDVVPLRGENRVFVKYGMKELGSTNRIGIKALMDVARLDKTKMDSSSIGFILAPRLNAAGRIGTSSDSVELLLSKDYNTAFSIACGLDKQNRKRQELEAKILKEAIDVVEQTVDFSRERVIVLDSQDWHQGVIGIVASRIKERFYRPTILVSTQSEIGKGSGRSIKDFHLFDAVKNSSKYLEKFGGHKHAVGISIEKSNVPLFRRHINEFATLLPGEVFVPSMEIDSLISLSDIDDNLLDFLESMQPFGTDNPGAVFVSNNLHFKTRPVIIGNNTIKCFVTDGKNVYEALGFKMGSGIERISSFASFDLAYALNRNQYNGQTSTKLFIKDIREHGLK